MIKKFLKEPLLHFLLIGASLFVLYDVVAPPQQDYLSITVTAGQQEALKARFQNTWQRPPKPSEMESLIEDYILDEVYYREAKAIGMDENDSNIRQRLRQKMAFLLAEAAAQTVPTPEQLTEFYENNQTLFTRPAIYSFEQILIPESASKQEISAMFEQLQRGDRPAGAASMLSPAYYDNTTRQIEQLFGASFAAELTALPSGTWSPVVSSALGKHFVRITDFQAPDLPPLESVKAQVTQRWLDSKKQERTQLVNEQLLAKYEINIVSDDG